MLWVQSRIIGKGERSNIDYDSMFVFWRVVKIPVVVMKHAHVANFSEKVGEILVVAHDISSRRTFFLVLEDC